MKIRTLSVLVLFFVVLFSTSSVFPASLSVKAGKFNFSDKAVDDVMKKNYVSAELYSPLFFHDKINLGFEFGMLESSEEGGISTCEDYIPKVDIFLANMNVTLYFYPFGWRQPKFALQPYVGVGAGSFHLEKTTNAVIDYSNRDWVYDNYKIYKGVDTRQDVFNTHLVGGLRYSIGKSIFSLFCEGRVHFIEEDGNGVDFSGNIFMLGFMMEIW